MFIANHQCRKTQRTKWRVPSGVASPCKEKMTSQSTANFVGLFWSIKCYKLFNNAGEWHESNQQPIEKKMSPWGKI